VQCEHLECRHMEDTSGVSIACSLCVLSMRVFCCECRRCSHAQHSVREPWHAAHDDGGDLSLRVHRQVAARPLLPRQQVHHHRPEPYGGRCTAGERYIHRERGHQQMKRCHHPTAKPRGSSPGTRRGCPKKQKKSPAPTHGILLGLRSIEKRKVQQPLT